MRIAIVGLVLALPGCADLVFPADEAGTQTEPNEGLKPVDPVVVPDAGVVADAAPPAEICDGEDNNGDGQVDEGLRVGQACDGDDADRCATGRWACAADGTAVCVGDDSPRFETCNGHDDDCNGATDDGIADQTPHADKWTGVCAGQIKICAGESGWIEPDYTKIDDYEAEELSCDGRDNDCDGTVDEAEPSLAARQLGVCEGVRQVCAGREGWREPDYATAAEGFEAVEQSCDGLDNDCDGRIDETLVTPPCALFEGVCAAPAGPSTCRGAEGWSECDYGVLYQHDEIDTCDSLDNDCDGSVDEGELCPFVRQAMVILPGEFVMGSPADQAGRGPDETPHRVVITRSILVRRTELTQGEWREVLGNSPSAFRGDDRPVESVSWLDAVRFLNALSLRDGFPPCYDFPQGDPWPRMVEECLGWRLPTEAEWEYFARAGTETRFWSGQEEADLVEVAWYAASSGGQTHSVGLLRPNHFGLHDVHGNVGEWVWDRYSPYWPAPADQVLADPVQELGERVIVRGGGYRSPAAGVRSAARANFPRDGRAPDVGLRPVRSLPPGLEP